MTALPGGHLVVDAGLAARGVRLALAVGEGETVAVMGPNGAGKSTLFGLCAGLLRPDTGSVTLAGRVLADARGAWIPPHRRGVALLAQEPLLFPHLSVLENVAFAPRAAGAPRAEARAAAGRWLREVDAEELAGRRPAELSGGQAQRVAIARALAAEPRVLLLDEPFAALDVAAAPALRRLLRRVLADRTALVVTHEPLDAHLLADRVVVLESGRVAESGPTAELLDRPRSRFAAGLAGLNFVEGRAASGRTTPPGRLSVDGLGEVSGTVPDGVEPPRPGEAGVAVFRPADVALYPVPTAPGGEPGVPHGSPRNAWRGVVRELEPRGAQVRVHCGAGGHALVADLTPAAAAELDLAPGAAVVLVAKAAAVTVYGA
ncbi:ABC transporter, ATP-binding protein [Sinomonas atrocyanea]|uniref:ABC transporter, ATP-binding protein n=1 Tax=Sinomonas atrocyanea TaxID=37927 RepID=A0A126ZVL6_9MICC|nr:ABC transporter, ATP-binding protein [Sinomonas atrocyanea]GEB65881.1 molybdenum ABC transporter ATP-binding protein [Sinomonas atrocyanea]